MWPQSSETRQAYLPFCLMFSLPFSLFSDNDSFQDAVMLLHRLPVLPCIRFKQTTRPYLFFSFAVTTFLQAFLSYFFQLAYRLRLVPVSAMRCINSPSCSSSSLWRASVDSVQELRFFLSSLLFAISVRVIFRVLAFIPFAFEFESDDVNTPFSMSSPIFWHLLRLKHDFR